MVLDTSALVAILFREAEADEFSRLILDADQSLVSTGTYLELCVVIERQATAETRLQAEAFIRRAEIVIEPFTVEQAEVASQAFHDFGKGRHPAGLNFGDCFAYALAKVSGEPLLFKGEDFTKTDLLPARGA